MKIETITKDQMMDLLRMADHGLNFKWLIRSLVDLQPGEVLKVDIRTQKESKMIPNAMYRINSEWKKQGSKIRLTAISQQDPGDPKKRTYFIHHKTSPI